MWFFFGGLYLVFLSQIIFASLFMVENGYDAVIRFVRGPDMSASGILLVNLFLIMLTAWLNWLVMRRYTRRTT